MAYDEVTANYIRMSLASEGEVEEKTMFGGRCFMLNEKMCICLNEEELLCRIGAPAVLDAVELPGCHQMMNGNRVMKDFVGVSLDVFRTIPQRSYWIKLALAFNATAKPSKKKKNIGQ